MGTVGTKTRRSPGTQTRGGTATEPPWNVVLHNDFENSMTRVVVVIKKVIPGMSYGRAVKIMWQAHTSGRATAKSCHKELAELYEERLQKEGLTASIEPAA